MTAPVMDRACKIPTAAEALCSTAVKTIPTMMPKMGLEKVVSRWINSGLCRKGETAPLMLCIPNISTAKPSRMSPTCQCCCFLENMRRIMPITATTAVRVEVESKETQPLPSTLDRQMIQPVTLVPMRAPSIMATACSSFIMPEFTKPTTITEVADEDWIIAVTAVPRKTPFSGVLERR